MTVSALDLLSRPEDWSPRKAAGYAVGIVASILGLKPDLYAVIAPSIAITIRGKASSSSKGFQRTYWFSRLIDAADEIRFRNETGEYHVYFHIALHDIWASLAESARACFGDTTRRSPDLDAYPAGDGVSPDVYATYFRGKISSAYQINCVWLDIDFGVAGHAKKRLPPDRESATAIIQAIEHRLGLSATFVVDTGGGFHVYWLFKEPIQLRNSAETDSTSALISRFHDFAAKVASEVGVERTGHPFELDMVSDLARVLRVPFTGNIKHDPPRVAKISRWSGHRHALAEIKSKLDSAAPEEVRERTTHRESVRKRVGPPVRLNALPPSDVTKAIVDRLIATDRLFAALWTHTETADRPAHWRAPDTSVSGYDFRIAQRCIRLGLSDIEVGGILSMHRSMHGRGGGHQDVGYLARTIRNAREKSNASAFNPDRAGNALARQASEEHASLDAGAELEPCDTQDKTVDASQPQPTSVTSPTSPSAAITVRNDDIESVGLSTSIDDHEEVLDEATSTDAPLPPLARTRETIMTAEDGRRVCASIAEEWVPGKGSVHLAGWPGVSKTTSFARRTLRGLHENSPGFQARVAVLAVPTRRDVHEKRKSIESHASTEGLNVSVIDMLGRSNDRNDIWWCEEHERQRLHSELRRSSCGTCRSREACNTLPDRYHTTRVVRLKRISDAHHERESPVLIVATHAALRWLLKELPVDAPIIIDDAGPLFRLSVESAVRHNDLQAAIDAAIEFRDEPREPGYDLESQVAAFETSLATLEARKESRRALVEAIDGSNSRVDAVRIVHAWVRDFGIDRERALACLPDNWTPAARKKASLAAERVDRYATRAPDLLVADFAVRVLEALRLRRRDRKFDAADRVQRVVEQLPESYKTALREDLMIPPLPIAGPSEWYWEIAAPEDGPELRPAFTDLAIIVARECLNGAAPVVARTPIRQRKAGTPEHVVYLPDHPLRERAERGYVAWLGVGPMPAEILRRLGCRQEIVVAKPIGFEIRALLMPSSPPYESFGTGRRTPTSPSDADSFIRHICSSLNRAAAANSLTWFGTPIDRVGAILHRDDWVDLGRPEWAGYYGRDNASTDRFERSQLLVVRRFMPPYSRIALEATSLRRTFRIADCPKSGSLRKERRQWSESEIAITTAVFKDPFERELQRHHELHGMLNAIGRSRPLNHPEDGRHVLLLAGRPFELVAPTLISLDDLPGCCVADLPESLKRRRFDSSKRITLARDSERSERLDRLRDLLDAGHPNAPSHLARTLQVSVATVRRDLSTLRPSPDQRSRSVTPCIRYIYRTSDAS